MLSQEIKRYEESIAEGSRFIQHKVGSPEELNSMNRATLVHICLELGERVKVVESEGVEYKQRFMEGQAARQKYAEQIKQLQDLSEAHMQQSYFIQKLQKKVAKMDSYKSTIKLQESIIGKMQKVVEAHLKTSALDAGGGGRNDLLDRLMTEIENSEQESQAERKFQEKIDLSNDRARDAEENLLKVRKVNEQLEEELQRVKVRLMETEAEPPADTNETRLKVEQLEAELTVAQYRIAAMEEQIEAAAQESGKEISRLRTRLFDFEMAAILAEDVDNPTFENEDAYVPVDIDKAPTGSAMEAANAIKESKSPTPDLSKQPTPAISKAESAASIPTLKVEMCLTDEIQLSLPYVAPAFGIGRGRGRASGRYGSRAGTERFC